MKKFCALFAVSMTISSTTAPGNVIYWALWGPVDVSTMTAPAPSPTVVSSTATAVQLKATSGDCYNVFVNPNGTLGTTWTKCQ